MTSKKGKPKDVLEYRRGMFGDTAAGSGSGGGGGENGYAREKTPFLDLAAVAPSPSRDYYRIYVTNSEVALTQWRISHGPKSVPIELKIPLESFARDIRLPSEVNRVFGKECVDYIVRLSQGHVDKIMQLPDPVLATIFYHNGIENLKSVAPVCNKFSKVCRSDDLWKLFYLKYGGMDATEAETKYQADYLSWKSLFFINRLQYKIGDPERFPGLFGDRSLNIPPNRSTQHHHHHHHHNNNHHRSHASSPSNTSLSSQSQLSHRSTTNNNNNSREPPELSSSRKFIRGRTARIVDGNLIPRASAAKLQDFQNNNNNSNKQQREHLEPGSTTIRSTQNSPRQKATRYTLVHNNSNSNNTTNTPTNNERKEPRRTIRTKFPI